MLTLLAVVVAACLAARLFSRHDSAEPVYQGKALRLWLADLDYSYREKDQAAQAAITQMGPRILPFVVPELHKRSLPFERQAWEASVRLFHGRQLWTPAFLRRNRAACAIRALGESGAVAVPELLAMLDGNPLDAWVAMTAFGAMGAKGLPGLMKALTNQQVRVRMMIPGQLAKLGPEARPALHALKGALTDSDPQVRARAHDALVQLAANGVPEASNFLPP